MVAGNTIVSFLCLFGVSLDAGLVAGSTSLTLSLSLTLTLALSLSLTLSLPSLFPRLPPLCSSLLPASPPTPCHKQAYNLSFPFLTPGSTPYRITACRGCLGLSRCSWQPHQPSFLQFTPQVTSFRFLFFLFLRLRTLFLSLPYAGVYTLLDNRVQGCLGLSLCSWQPHQPSSLKSHLLHLELSGA